MERFEVFQFFADADELDRLADDTLETQGRAAAGVAVQLGENGTGDIQRLIKMGGDVDRFLAGRRVEHEQDFLRSDQVPQANQFLDERFVDMVAAGSVKDECVATVRAGKLERVTGNFQDVRFVRLREHGGLQLPAKGFKLVHRRGPIDVRRDQQGSPPLLVEPASELALEVVLPEPCRPTISSEAGLTFSAKPAFAEPSR